MGQNDVVYLWQVDSPLGGITLASDGQALTGIWFDGQMHFGRGMEGLKQISGRELSVFEESVCWLDGYFSGKRPGGTPVIELSGTTFQMRVWTELRKIPYGETVTYGEIARNLQTELGRIVSARSVGHAVGFNPVSIMIPCHRVLGAGGKLTGYAGGLKRKEMLLRLEKEGHL